MDFSDITRSGTAPASKGKAYLAGFPSMGNVRPKTRAVDNDIQDTNSELRANRVKGNSGGGAGSSSGSGGPLNEVLESVISNLSEIGELDGPATGGSGGSGTSSGAGIGNTSNIRRDPPSRNRPSKDPRRVSGTNNLLNGSSISAYTQNIPNIVLNTSKKPSKPLSASGLRSKDPKNINQLNELRAAYGADIPLGKGEKLLSPPRPKSMRGQQQQQQPPPPASRTQMNSSGADRPVRSSKSNPVGGSGNGGVGSIPIPMPSHAASHEIPSQQSSPIHSPDTPVSVLKVIEPIALHNPVAATRRTSIEEEKDYSKDPQVKNSNNRNAVCSTSQGSRTKSSSFTTKALLKSSLVTNRGNNTSPAPLPVSASHHDNNAFVEVVERSANEKSVVESATAAVIASVNAARKTPGAQSTCADSPPREVEEEEKLAKSRDYSNSSNKVGVGSMTLKGTPLPPPIGMELQLPDDLGYASPDCDGELDEECPMISDEDQGRSYGHHIYPSLTPPMINRPTPIDCDDDNMQMPERPTSRKLYLGSDKKTEKSVSKAPRSAGARFGHVSPISGGIDLDKIPQPRSPQVRNYILKKNGSFNDVQNRRWLEEQEEIIQRPPSRQSSAFPVHLADAPSTGCTVSTAGSSSDQNGAGSGGKSPFGGEFIVTSGPARIAAEQACLDDYDVEESLVIDDTLVDAPTSMAVGQDGSVVPNSEPISVKKTRSSGDEESTSSSPRILRPPSRQKLAAQHLFDGHHKPAHPVLEDHASIDRWNKTEGEARRSSGSLVNSTVDSNLKPNTTASGRLRSLRTATRAGGGTSNGYDPSRDGFTDLDGGDNNLAPFVFTVSYGTEDSTQRRHVSSHGSNKMTFDEEEFRSSDVSNESLLRKSIVNASPNSTVINSNSGNINNMTTSNMTAVNNNNSSNNNGIPTLGNKKLDNSVINSIPFPAPVRPKSVSAMDPSPWVHQVSRPGRVTKLSSGNTGVGESEALRSKSANISHHQHAALHNHPSSQLAHVKPLHHDGGMAVARQSPVSSTGAWSEGYEANYTAPRAKNPSGLGADSGWTSPSLLAQTGAQYVNPSSSLSTFSQDHQEAFYNRDEEDDGTIWTDEESGAHFEHDMSMQSFQLESSLGEDFLSLFAPAGR